MQTRTVRRKYMKMSKRIFIALLIVSVIVSALAFSAFAAENDDLDYGYLLEYYEEPILFDYDFSKDDVTYSLFTNEDDKSRITSTVVEDATAPGGKYLSVKVPASQGFWEDVLVKNNVYFNWNADEAIDDFVLDMTVSGQRGDGEEKQLPKIIVSVADEPCTNSDDAASIGTTLAALDFRSGCFAYNKKTTNTEGDVYGVYTNTEFVLSEGAWYNVYVAYNSENQTATVTVTDLSDPANVFTVTDAFLPYTEIENVRVGAHGIDGAAARDSVMNFASLRALGGKNDRNPAELQTVVEQGVLDMYADFISDSVDFSDREYLSDVAIKLSAHGFTPVSEEAVAAFAELLGGTAPYCNTKLAAYIESYAALSDYYEKRALVDEALVYVAYASTLDASDVPADVADALAANIEAINGFDTALNNARDGSIDLIDAVGDSSIDDIDLDDYQVVCTYFEYLHPYGQYADATYEGVAHAYKYYHDIRGAKEDIEVKGDKFLAAIAVLNSDADFNTRAQAFLVCKNNYCDNTTYKDIADALVIYNNYYDTMNTAIEMAENFIKYVEQADYAIYVPMKLDNLAEAEKYMGCLTSDPYVGVTEAKELYDRVKVEVDQKVRDAEAYVAAVNALDSLTGDALTRAIQTALQLQTAGNVLGVDGVAEANIKLDKLVSSIELAPKHREYFLTLVNSIDTTSSKEALFELLKEAKSAEVDALAVAGGDSDIIAASQKLAAAIASYNAQVTAVNNVFAQANEVAAKTVGIGKNVTPVADRVIALIKKFFED